MRRCTCFMSLLCFAATVLLYASFGAGVLLAQTEVTPLDGPSQQHQPIFVPSTDNILTLSLDRLGGEKVTIWNDTRIGKRYYFIPSLIPDWRGFSTAIDDACQEHADAQAIEKSIITVRLNISLSDEHYEEEIRIRLATLSGDSQVQEDNQTKRNNLIVLPEDKLSAVPHDNIQIILKENSALSSRLLHDARDRARLSSDDSLQSPPFVRYPRDIRTPIFGTCKELNDLLGLALDGEDLLGGRIYFSGIRYQTTTFWAEINSFLNSTKSLDLFGDERLVTRKKFTNTSAQAGVVGLVPDALHINLSVGQHSGRGVSSRQRILSRDYLDHVKSTSFTSIAGGCVEASVKDGRCTELQEMFMEFLLRHAKEVELTFRRLESGSYELVSDQERYATLSAEEYKTIAKATPEAQVTTGGVSNGGASKSSGSQKSKAVPTLQTSDNVTWEFSGVEPVPTRVTLFVLDEQSLRSSIGVEWFNRVPVEEGFQDFVVALDYFGERIADGRILAHRDFVEKEKLQFSCKSGGQIASVTVDQIRTPSSRHTRIENARTIRHRRDGSRECSINFRGEWHAKEGYFFLLSGEPVFARKSERWRSKLWKLYPSVEPHQLDVPKKDGNYQIASAVRYEGTARNKKSAKKKSCGGRVRFNLQQYPNACAPFLVDGFWERHGALEASDLE